MFYLIKSPKGKLDEVKGWSIFINTICQLFHICHLSTSPPKLMLLGSLLNIWLWNFRLFLFDDPHLLFSFRLCSRRQTWVSSISLFLPLSLIPWGKWTRITIFGQSWLIWSLIPRHYSISLNDYLFSLNDRPNCKSISRIFTFLQLLLLSN